MSESETTQEVADETAAVLLTRFKEGEDRASGQPQRGVGIEVWQLGAA
jgi:hypothetical protein